jgi:hypothetical protein
MYAAERVYKYILYARCRTAQMKGRFQKRMLAAPRANKVFIARRLMHGAKRSPQRRLSRINID